MESLGSLASDINGDGWNEAGLVVAGEKAEGDTVCPCNSERKDHGRSVWGSSSLIIGDACRSSEFPFGEIGDLDSFPSISSAVFTDPSAPDGLCSSSALRRRTTKKMARPTSAKITEATLTMPTMAPVLRFEESSVEEAVVGLGGTADGVDVEEPVPAVKVAWELAESREEVIVWTKVVLGLWKFDDIGDDAGSEGLEGSGDVGVGTNFVLVTFGWGFRDVIRIVVVLDARHPLEVIVTVDKAGPDSGIIKLLRANGIFIIFVCATSDVGGDEVCIETCTFLEAHVAELAAPDVAKSRIATGDIVVWKGDGLRRSLPVTGAVADVRVKAVDGAAEVARKKAKADHCNPGSCPWVLCDAVVSRAGRTRGTASEIRVRSRRVARIDGLVNLGRQQFEFD
ncbi:hypothetical protein NEUTE2DRAFT_156458 [Neurospora tetrasperma FGSC 2509]|nr:hypothetical protein NEUTE2DRAFT_156458 [Neurospora tetrasperma FGSC 2509]